MFCENHKTMMVDMYCKNHNVVICSACKIASHRTCKITSTFSKQTQQMNKDGLFNKTEKHLEDLKLQHYKMKVMMDKEKSRLTVPLEQFRDDMHQIRREINETFDIIEANLSKEIRQAGEMITQDIEGHIAVLDDGISQITEQLRTLEASENAQDDRAKFVGMKISQIAQNKYADTLAELKQAINQIEHQFEINATINDALKQLQSVETVLINKQVNITGTAHGQQRRQTSLSKMSISRRRGIDIGRSDVYGCTFMPDGNLVLCCGSQGLKLLDKDFKIMSKLQGDAWCAAVMNDTNTFIVTLGKQIQIVKICPQMKVSKTMKMDRHCWGVAVYGDEIYVTCNDIFGGNGEVWVLNMDGEVQRSLGLNMFTRPYYLTINNDGSRVFVSDRFTHTVTCLDTQGHVIYRYLDTDLNAPLGLHVDCEGVLYVCSYGRNNVHVIGKYGSKETILLTAISGVKSPRCIAFRQSDGCLIVGMKNNKNKSLIKYTA